MKGLKKLLCFVLSISMLLTMTSVLSPIGAGASDEATIFTYTVNSDGTTCAVTGFTDEFKSSDAYFEGAKIDIEIPEKIEGYTVVEIADSAFSEDWSDDTAVDTQAYRIIKTLTLPSTVKRIGNSAFKDCGSLVLNEWPSSLEEIGDSAFVHCSAIEGDFPASLKSIGASAFNFSALKAIGLKEGITSIGKKAFSWTTGGIKTAIFPDSLVSLGDESIKTNTTINVVRFPRNDTFKAIPANTLNVDYPAVQTRDTLYRSMSIYIPETITSVPSGLLTNFIDGAEVTIYGVSGSAAYTFYQTTKAALAAGTYKNQRGGQLASISFVEYDFENDQILDLEPNDEGVNKGDGEFNLVNIEKVSNTSVEVGLSGVGGKLAEDKVIKVSAGDALPYYMGTNVSGGNAGVVEFSVLLPDSDAYTSISGGIYNTPKFNVGDATTYTQPTFLKITTSSVIFMDKVLDIKINTNQWYNIALTVPNGGRKTVVLYINGVRYTGETAHNSYGLRHLRIYHKTATNPYDIYYDNVKMVGAETVSYCPAWVVAPAYSSDVYNVNKHGIFIDEEQTVSQFKENIITDADVIRVYTDASYKTLLEDGDVISDGAAVVFAKKNGFEYEKSFSYATINPPVNDGLYAISVISEENKTAAVTGWNTEFIPEGTDLSVVDIPSEIVGYNIVEIADGAFEGNDSIKTVKIPETVTKIGNNAFKGGSGSGKVYGVIESVSLPSGLKEIGDYAFACQNKLEKIELPYGLTTLGAQAFYWNYALKQMIIPDTVTSMGANMFRLCSALDFVKLPAGLKAIPNGLFSASDKARHIVIPETITADTSSKNTFGNYDIDNVIYGVNGSWAEEFANEYGYKFVGTDEKIVQSYVKLFDEMDLELKGTDHNLRYKPSKISYRAIYSNFGEDDVEAMVVLRHTDADGELIEEKTMDVTIGAHQDISLYDAVTAVLDGKSIDNAHTVTAYLALKDNPENKLTSEYSVTFDVNKKELRVLMYANSFGDDAFAFLHQVAAADGVELKAHNMFIGNCTIGQHYANAYYNTEQYRPDINGGAGVAGSMTFIQALESDKWDVIGFQAGSHGYSKDLAFINSEQTETEWDVVTDKKTNEKINLTAAQIYEGVKNKIMEYHPDAKRVFHWSWGPTDEAARSSNTYSGKYSDVSDEPDVARHTIYADQKKAAAYAAGIYSTEDYMMVPTAAAVEYAMDVLGFPAFGPFDVNHSSNAGKTEASDTRLDYYVSSSAAMFRDDTCHLASPYGRVLAALTWYEYLTGNDARENQYQNSGITEEDMVKLKQAAHWACSLEEVNPAVEEAEISVAAINGTIEASVDGEEVQDFGASKIELYPMGTKITLTAKPVGDATFLYWKDDISGAIVSKNANIDIVVGTKRGYTAVFAENENGVYITFTSNGLLYGASGYNSVVVPADPYIQGYKFDGWCLDNVKTSIKAGEVVTPDKNAEYIAGFIRNATKYTVSITDGDIAGGEYLYNDSVKVTAADKSSEDLVFTHWERDGKVVSYNKTYSFYVNGDTVVVAKYAQEAAENQPVVVMAAAVKMESEGKIAFYAERDIPAEYTVVETGIILSTGEEFDLSTEGVLRAIAKSTDNKGQYTIRKANVSAGDTWYGKAYVVYADNLGDYHTIYSNKEGLTF